MRASVQPFRPKIPHAVRSGNLPGHLLSIRNMKPVFIAACALSLLAGARGETYDLVILHGRVVDGSGNPAYFADVAVKDGRIAVIGSVTGEAKTEIEAKA